MTLTTLLRLTVFGLVLIPAAHAPALAQTLQSTSTPIERDLGTDLAHALDTARTVQSALQSGAPVTSAGTLVTALDRIRAGDLLLAQKHRSVEKTLIEGGAASAILVRQAQMATLTRAQLDPLVADATALQGAIDAGDRAAAAAAVEAVIRHLGQPPRASVDRTPLGVTLPNRSLSLPQVAPALDAAIVPAYLQPDAPQPTAADLAGAPEATLTPDIVEQARLLGHSPIAIFEFVQGQLGTEFYYGAMKGAHQTLVERSGNDTDQASLLIALLRASGIPARYVRGVIKISDADAQAWTSLGSIKRAADLLTRGGVPFVPVRQGGVIAALQVEHTWVEAFVPYANYRGAPLDIAGRAWVPLDPSFKTPQVSGTQALPAGFVPSALIDEYLAAPQEASPVAFFLQKLSVLLAADSGASLEQVLFTKALPATATGLLPSTLPYTTVSVNGEYAELPASLRHMVRVTADGDEGVAFDVTIPTSELLGRRLTLSYVPATVDDQIAANAFLGLDNTPAYLVRVRPVLKVAGAIRGAGEATLQMGALHRMTIEVRTPRSNVPIVNNYVAGGYYAIGLGASRTTYAAAAADDEEPQDTERPAAHRLYQLAAEYLGAWNDADRSLASLLRIVPATPTVSEVVIGNVYNRTLLFGQPQQVEWRGVFVDADLRISEPVPVGTVDTAARDFLRMSGLAGSMLESGVLESSLQVDSVSAAKLLQLARQASIPIRQIDTANVAAELPLLETADVVRTDISDAVRQGWRVTIPQRDLTHNIWTGIGYVVSDATTGASGYFISGGLAGGMSSEDPAEWVQQQYVRELGHPYQDEPNTDVRAAFSIRKVAVSDQQEGVVGQPLPRPLAVWVRDAEGKPVEGANVTFTILTGGGSFAEGATVQVKTDSLGIASALPTLGQHTADAPFYVYEDPEDTYATQVGENLVQARVTGSGGDIALDAPFQVYGFPGEPSRILKILGEGNSALVGTAAGTLRARLVDQYDNPISNARIDFDVLPPAPIVGGPLPEYALNMSLYERTACNKPAPILGDCATLPHASIDTSIFGADVETMMGDTVATRYEVRASAQAVEPVVFTLSTRGNRDYSDEPGYIGPTLTISQMALINDRGQLLNAAAVGTEFKRALGATLMLGEDNFTLVPTGTPDCVTQPPGPPCYKMQVTRTLRMRAVDIHKAGAPIVYTGHNQEASAPKQDETANVSFGVVAGGGVMNPAVASRPEDNPFAGQYFSRLTVGAEPALNVVELDATAQVYAPDYNLYTGEVTPRLITMHPGDRFFAFAPVTGEPSIATDRLVSKLKHQVFGVRARILNKENVLIGASGGTTADFDVEYRIEPAAYNADLAEIDLFRVGSPADTWLGLVPGDQPRGDGKARIHRGTGGFDPTKDYRAQLVLNRGSEAEVRSDKQELGAYLTAPFGLDFRSRENTAENSRKKKTVDLKDALEAEKAVLRSMISSGLREGASCGVPMAELSIIEQGSGACFWRPLFDTNPVQACASFQPKVSDHDYEVFIPTAYGNQAACVVEALNKAGEDADLGEVSFFAVAKEEFVSGRLNIDPPSGGGADVTGDLGLGRQSLLLKWALEGEYVNGVPELAPPAISLGTVLERLRTTPIVPGEPTGIPRLEGFEWATLQEYNFYKSKSHVRLTGKAVDPKSYLYELRQKELHDAAKAGIRAAMGRLVAHPEGNKLLFITRDQYQSATGCLTGTENPSAPRSPLALFPKMCDSFEEHIASAAVRSLRDNLEIFTAADVALIYQFYRIKADAPCATGNCNTQIVSETDGDAFAASTLRFIQNVAGATKGVYDQILASGRDERAAQRLGNAERAELKRADAARTAKRTIEERVINANELEIGATPLDMYSDAAPSPVTPWTRYPVPRIQSSSETIVDVKKDADGQPIRDERGRLQKVFTPEVPADATKFVSFVLDPENTVRECNKQDNFTGFFTYKLDPTNPVPVPGLPDYPQSPVRFPDPPSECTEKAVPSLSVSKLVNGQPQIKITPNTPVTITHVVSNTGTVPVDGAMIADLLTGKTYGPFTLAPGQTRQVTDTFRSVNVGKKLVGPSEAIAFAQGGFTATAWDSIGIDVVSPPCPVAITLLDPDPNPYDTNGMPVSTVMQGGSLFRYYRVTGVSGEGVVTYSINGRQFTATIDAEGYLTHPRAEGDDESAPEDLRGLEIKADDIGVSGRQEVRFEAVNGSPSVCSQPFFVEVTTREFSRGYAVGAGIEAAATAAAGLAGKAGVGFGVSIDEKVDGSRSKLSIDRSVNGALGVQVGLSTPKLRGTIPGLRGEIGASAQTSVLGTLMLGDSHEFAFANGAARLAPAESRAFGGLLLGTMAIAAFDDPFIFKLLSSAADLTNYQAYQSGFSVALGVDTSLGGEAAAMGGLQAVEKGQNADFSTLTFGVGAGVSGGVGESVNIGVDLKFKDLELVPNFSAKFTANIGGSIGIGDMTDTEDQKTKERALKMTEWLKASFKGSLSETWKVKLALDATRGYEPKKLSISFASQKGFGWKAVGKQYREATVSGDPEKVTFSYSMSDKAVIGELIDHLTTIKELARIVGGVAQETTGVMLGPSLLDEELLHLVQILAKADADWDVSGEIGNGIELPFDIDVGAGARVKVGAAVNMDRSVGYTKEKGTIKKGTLYRLERYRDTDLISGRLPDSSDLSDVHQIFTESLDGLVSAVNFAIDTVTATVTEGVNRIRSRHTAELAFDGATAPFQEVAITSFTFDPVAGPVASTMQLPGDTSGPADLPHYGVGGYHQFLPKNAQLSAPATLTFFYKDDEVTSLDEGTLGIYSWNAATSNWDFIGGTVDPENNTITTTVRTLGLYTAAPPMPGSRFTFSSRTSAAGSVDEPRTAVQYTSSVIRMNTGQVVPDGTLFTVSTLSPQGTDLVPFGTIMTTDEDPVREGVQIRSVGGVIRFSAEYPGAFGAVRVLVYSTPGTALADQVVPYQ